MRFLLILSAALMILAAVAAPRPADAASIASGDIIVADPGAGMILKIDPVSGGQDSITAKLANSVTTRSSVFAVWITIGFFEVQGGDGVSADTTISPGGLLGDPVDITRATPRRAFFIIDRSKAVPLVVDIDTGAQTPLPGPDFLIEPSGVAFDENSEELFIADASGPIFRYDPMTGVSSIVATGGNLMAPSDIDVSPEGILFVLDSGAAALIEIDPDTGVQTMRATAVPWSRLSIESSGTTAIVLDPTLPALQRVDLTTGVATPLSSGGLLSSPVDLTIAPPPEPSVHGLGWEGQLMLVVVLGATAGLIAAAQRRPNQIK